MRVRARVRARIRSGAAAPSLSCELPRMKARTLASVKRMSTVLVLRAPSCAPSPPPTAAIPAGGDQLPSASLVRVRAPQLIAD